MSNTFLMALVELEEPAIFSCRHEAGNLSRTHNYIPGSIILGALANYFIYEKNGSADEDDFKGFFLSEDVKFGNLYPAFKEEKAFYHTIPIPLSTFTCKHYPGINKKNFRGEQHSFADFLISEMANECQTCHAPLKNREGYYFYKKPFLYYVETRKIIKMHNVIDDKTQKPEENAVFSFEAIAEEEYFTGIIIFSNEDIKSNFVNKIFGGEKEIELSIGKGKSRGYGKCKLKIIAERQGEYISSFLIKRDFDTRWEDWQKKGQNTFSLTLYSDAIITDKYLRHLTVISEEWFKEELGIDVNLIKYFSKPIFIDGFSGVYGLPLEQEIGISKGSTFLYRFNSNKSEEIKDKLENLEKEGIGFRKNEGFGWLIVCDDYHVNWGDKWEK
ncbi:MAG: RAMP superfamily CRISPR-associated protein [Candidatus Omnitrophica bacterium]|nr:RAMP superfamily CRISPR-associated protein [Candidatus Omnitrophota bacterium]